MLLACAHILHERTGKTAMALPQVAKYACQHGPACCRPLANAVKYSIYTCLFVTYFCASAAYTVIVAKNVDQLVEYYLNITVDLRVCLIALVLPFVIISWIPDLKWLAKVTFAANLCMLAGLAISLFYLVIDIPPISERDLFGPLATIPSFFALVIFAFEAIGVILPLKKQMQQPELYERRSGIMAQGLFLVILIYSVIGILGYVKYGGETRASITLNLPADAT
jgi:solute carrier family 36 (proton-coupled amino acid transporter)